MGKDMHIYTAGTTLSLPGVSGVTVHLHTAGQAPPAQAPPAGQPAPATPAAPAAAPARPLPPRPVIHPTWPTDRLTAETRGQTDSLGGWFENLNAASGQPFDVVLHAPTGTPDDEIQQLLKGLAAANVDGAVVTVVLDPETSDG